MFLYLGHTRRNITSECMQGNKKKNWYNKMGFFNWNGPAIVIQLIGGILMSVAIFLPYWLAVSHLLNHFALIILL